MKATNTRKTITATTTTMHYKRTDRGIPFDEMRRLMSTYGSIKCLRKRQKSPTAGEGTKIDSVKRKFYRWFPDLEERFYKDERTGAYHPRAGHEVELRYREEMRTKDGELLAKKRTRCRKGRVGGDATTTTTAGRKNKRAKTTTTATARSPRSSSKINYTPDASPSSSSANITADVARSSSSSSAGIVGRDITVIFEHDPISSSANIGSDTDPVDLSFSTQQGIFDDVEHSFYGGQSSSIVPAVPEEVPSGSAEMSHSCVSANSSDISFERLPSSSDSSNWEEEASSSSYPPTTDHNDTSSWDEKSSCIEETLEKSLEECCEEVLVTSSSSSDESVSNSLFEIMIG